MKTIKSIWYYIAHGDHAETGIAIIRKRRQYWERVSRA